FDILHIVPDAARSRDIICPPLDYFVEQQHKRAAILGHALAAHAVDVSPWFQQGQHRVVPNVFAILRRKEFERGGRAAPSPPRRFVVGLAWAWSFLFPCVRPLLIYSMTPLLFY